MTADDTSLESISELSTDANHLLGFHLDDLPPSCETLHNMLLEAVSVECVEHITQPLAVEMDPVNEVGHMSLHWLRLESELQNVRVGEARDGRHFRNLHLIPEDVL
jgi:hypothetical protein